ncbi:hypothetical protein FJ934_04530 [Mesorhizobium sp. B2-4-12]|uniref:hypothetical protein n=1 Tax=Mesorhizobium sp. B2-4-12 TaxID=2589937 RepID=UPI00112C069D|nr:hypothetical protein [Mesorhizobium sp. B2-4-12]TPK98002.1 hypothetical protein FJ934_04530 [Mesorhizobium sp. B2-4-12]
MDLQQKLNDQQAGDYHCGDLDLAIDGLLYRDYVSRKIEASATVLPLSRPIPGNRASGYRPELRQQKRQLGRGV